MQWRSRMSRDVDQMLDEAFADHMKRQPKPRPTNYQAYWFGLGVKAARREGEERIRELERRLELAAGIGAGNGHGA